VYALVSTYSFEGRLEKIQRFFMLSGIRGDGESGQSGEWYVDQQISQYLKLPMIRNRTMEHETVQKTSRFSKLKVGLAAVALGALLVVPSAGAENVFSDTENVDFTITGGDFTVGLSGGTMANIDTYGLDMDTTGSVDVDVTDLRGTDGNWTVSLQADNFQIDDGEATIPASGLSVSSAGTVDFENGNGDNVTPAAPGDLSNASPIGSGTNAHGAFSWTPLLALDVPDGTPAGTYSSVLTLTSDVSPE
jgi:hypothetical protein